MLNGLEALIIAITFETVDNESVTEALINSELEPYVPVEGETMVTLGPSRSIVITTVLVWSTFPLSSIAQIVIS